MRTVDFFRRPACEDVLVPECSERAAHVDGFEPTRANVALHILATVVRVVVKSDTVDITARITQRNIRYDRLGWNLHRAADAGVAPGSIRPTHGPRLAARRHLVTFFTCVLARGSHGVRSQRRQSVLETWWRSTVC